jgi:hypothetical protein
MVERREQVEVDARVAAILGCAPHVARRDLAVRVAVFGRLPLPRRAETNRLLSELALQAGRLPDAARAHGPLDRDEAALLLLSPVRPDDRDLAMAICAAELGALERPDPVPYAPELEWTLGNTIGVALDELVEPVAFTLVDRLAAAGHLRLA